MTHDPLTHFHLCCGSSMSLLSSTGTRLSYFRLPSRTQLYTTVVFSVQLYWISVTNYPPHSSDGRFGKKENESIRFDSLLCQNPLDSPHQGFWTLVLKLLDQSTEAMTGRTALQQSC